MNRSNYKFSLPLYFLLLLVAVATTAYYSYKESYYSNIDESDLYWESAIELRKEKDAKIERERQLAVIKSDEYTRRVRQLVAIERERKNIVEIYKAKDWSSELKNDHRLYNHPMNPSDQLLTLEPRPLEIKDSIFFDGVEKKPLNIAAYKKKTQDDKLNYIVMLRVEREVIIPGSLGILNVWIGGEEWKPTPFDDGNTTQAEKEMSYKDAGSALVQAVGYDNFEFDSTDTMCIKMPLSGNEAQFRFRPSRMESGDFQIGANVYVYSSIDCKGTPLTMYPEQLEVSVEVNFISIVNYKMLELVKITWDEAVNFWKAVVSLIFATALFLLRRKIQKALNWHDAH